MNYVSFLSTESKTPYSATTINRRNSSIGRGRGGGRTSKKKLLQARLGNEVSTTQQVDSLINNSCHKNNNYSSSSSSSSSSNNNNNENDNDNDVKNENNSIEMEQEDNNNSNNNNNNEEEDILVQIASISNDDNIVKKLWHEENEKDDEKSDQGEKDIKIVDKVINDKTIDKGNEGNIIDGTKLDNSIHPLIGLWEGTFDVKSPVNEGQFEKCHEIFFFHSKLGHQNDAIFQSLPPEPHFSYTIVKKYEFGKRFTSEIGVSSLYSVLDIVKLPGEDDDEEAVKSVLVNNDEKVEESTEKEGINENVNVELNKNDKNENINIEKEIDLIKTSEIYNYIDGKKIESPLYVEIKENNSIDDKIINDKIINDKMTNSIDKTNKKPLQVFIGFGRNAYGRFSLTATLVNL
jgi:hypothetical protein